MLFRSINQASYEAALGRPEQALATLDRFDPAAPDASNYTDLADKLPWWWNERAGAFGDLGRYDEEVAALRAGTVYHEHGSVNVSQVINLSSVQMINGRFDDALDTLAPLDRPGRPVSEYGEMQLRSVKACSLILSGHAQAADADEIGRAHV